MSDDLISWYLKQAGRIPLLTPQEEIYYGHQVQKWQELEHTQEEQDLTPEQERIIRNGKRAYKRMYEGNLRLVINVARLYLKSPGQFMALEDLIQEGNCGLARAVQKFDPTRGYKFSTYAYWWIRQAVRRSLSTSERSIRLPINAHDHQARIIKFMDEYRLQNGREPTLEECAEVSQVKLETLKLYLEHTKKPTSLNSPALNYPKSDSGYMSLLDLVAATEANPMQIAELDDGLDKILEIISELKPQQAAVIRHRYGLGTETKTFSSISKILGVSRERARQVEQLALKALRKKMIRRSNRNLAD